MAYNNYRNDYDNLNMWLSRVPNYEPRETDDVRQVDTKLKNQRVGPPETLRRHTALSPALYQRSLNEKYDEKCTTFFPRLRRVVDKLKIDL